MDEKNPIPESAASAVKKFKYYKNHLGKFDPKTLRGTVSPLKSEFSETRYREIVEEFAKFACP